jgi:hypothetical protein
LVERLDEPSGVTVTREREPWVFARTEARYSRSARDYLYLGPVETNRQGTREYYLWVGVGTTLDRGYLAPRVEPPETLYLTVHGEPIELALFPWRDFVPGSESTPLYATAVRVEAELAARVTLHQLALLAEESPASLVVDGAAAGPRQYFRWGDARSWDAFVAHAPRGPGRSPTTE